MSCQELDNLFRGSMTIHLICCDPAVSNQYGKIPNTDLPLWHFAFALVSLYFMRSTRSLNLVQMHKVACKTGSKIHKVLKVMLLEIQMLEMQKEKY